MQQKNPCRDCNGMRKDGIVRGFSRRVKVQLKECVLRSRCIIFLEYRDSLDSGDRPAIDCTSSVEYNFSFKP